MKGRLNGLGGDSFGTQGGFRGEVTFKQALEAGFGSRE